MPILTFLDANVLIAAYRGPDHYKGPCLRVMRDPSLSFAASEFLYLEVMPKPTYFGIKSEAEFYQRYFDRTIEFRADPDAIVRLATAEAQRCSMAAMDALHVAAASLAGCEILYTLERPDKPMYRTTLIRVTRITPA